MISALTQLRHQLHRIPELSGNEALTANAIKHFIQKHYDTKIIEKIGGYGLAAIYEFNYNGPSITIRCELDALPISEMNNIEYVSQHKGISHKCGHDGHMAIVAGLIFWIKEQNFQHGRIVLLFQPAEETGLGASDVLNDPKYTEIQSDYMFALHNIPGEEMHSIIYLKDGFSAEVQSYCIKLNGKEAHAAEPGNGINPASAMADLIHQFSSLNYDVPSSRKYKVLTPVHLNLGQKSYGISPGHGELHYTIRTWSKENMEILKKEVVSQLTSASQRYNLNIDIEWFEHFPASQNHTFSNEQVKKAAEDLGLNIISKPHPFKFGEDFGWFATVSKTAMFGLGAGTETPALHSTKYDFPDELIETGVKMFQSIINSILTTYSEKSTLS